MKIIILIYIVVLLVLSVVFQACEESLPEYIEPKNIVIGNITSPGDGSNYSISVFEKYWGTPDPITLRYPSVTFIGLNAIGLEITVKNIFNDVVSDSTFVGGYVKIWDPIDPENIVTQLIKKTDLSPNPDVLTLQPDQFVKLKVDCKLLNDEGRYIWLDKPYTEIESAYSPIPLKLKAYVRLYKKLGYAVTPEMSINLIVTGKRDYGP